MPLACQHLWRTRAALGIDWLLRSIRACGGEGSAVYYSRWFRPLRGWMWPYPETTGYIIPTLIRYGHASGRRDCIEVALRQADWILSLQDPDGALPGSHVTRGRKAAPSIFNTGQMLFGLCAAFDETGREGYLAGAHAGARWLAANLDCERGVWGAHAYVDGFSPAYYTRVAWPMLEVAARRPDEDVRGAARTALETIAGWRCPNGAIRNWGFKPDAPAFTHTIAYTLRGFWESGRLLEESRYRDLATVAADTLRRRLELRGRLAGAYDLAWQGRYGYTCLTGNCQLALLWMRCHAAQPDPRWLSAACKALQPVLAAQRIRHADPNVRGAIPGSTPFWGRYLTMRYPNWATKFFVDALLLADRQVEALREDASCG